MKFDFLPDESGAVTFEWIVLTAALIFLTVLMLSTIETATLDATAGTTTKMNTVGSGG